MKLLQLNMWQGRILWQVTHYLEQENPDIVCLQEVYSSKKPVPQMSFLFDSLEEVQKAQPHLKYWFFAPICSYEVAGRQVHAGNAIGSRYPISDERIEFIHGGYRDGIAPIPNTRNLQTCHVELPNSKRLSLANHHAYWAGGSPDGDEISVQKMQRVKEVTDALSRPFILAGDMNVFPDCPTMQLFDGVLENLTGTHKIETTLTMLARAFDHENIVACDHVLVSGGVQVHDFKASEAVVSDHKPLILEFDV
jgi:endonuclease/exonuclease/phosphatase family metal-dependent hydrolase